MAKKYDNELKITASGGLSFLPSCENGQMTVHSELSTDGSFYSYRIGLKALHLGDFVLSCNHSFLTIDQRNEFIFDDYPIELHPNQLGFNKCGNISWRFVNESPKEFYFRVE
ncbi:hypothetical protein [Bizionia paragorgiae]|uniref:Uncharacterized protein n=1 Tax=Bizionia paragorgiae TaxID=283786 RepID=A0A1H4C4C2_BIZPA|nr:hypothetical protein [Bizionia paragorgiae]SEA55295.1 hypothetical protein SAMN04487990_1182 [Bizionia paragorgiae]